MRQPRRLPLDAEAPRLPVTDHLTELRRRLVICALTLFVTSGAGFWMADDLLAWLKRPAGPLLRTLVFFSPTEGLVAYVKVAMAFGVVAALPVWLAQVWAFVRPGLTWRERTYGLAFVWWGSLCFVLGAEVGYGLLLPVFLKFLLGVGSPDLQPVISVSRYLSFVLGTMLWCGLLFELPVVVFLLSRMGVVSPQMMRRHRPLAVVVILIVAAIVTPTTDAVSLFLMALPLAVLYELSILVAASTRRRPSTPRQPDTPARPA